jgi:adenylate cyclase
MVGQELGVRYIVEESVRKAAGKVRIAGQLIDAITGAHHLSGQVQSRPSGGFALQDEVTVAVVSAIQSTSIQTKVALSKRRRPENLTAYDYYLRALQYYLACTSTYASYGADVVCFIPPPVG